MVGPGCSRTSRIPWIQAGATAMPQPFLFWYHVTEFHKDFYFLLVPFLRSRHQVGKDSASSPLCMASVLHAVGHISNFRAFSSSSCGPTPARLSRRLPTLSHLSFIWYGLGMTGRGARASGGRAVGTPGPAAESCQDLARSSPQWRSSILVFSPRLETFPNPPRAFPEALNRSQRSQGWKARLRFSLLCLRHSKTSPFRLLPSYPPVVRSCIRVSLYIMLSSFAFSLFIACCLLCSGWFPQSHWRVALPLYSPISPRSLKLPFLKHNFKWAVRFPPLSAPHLGPISVLFATLVRQNHLLLPFKNKW